jgi:hypothetical protein
LINALQFKERGQGLASQRLLNTGLRQGRAFRSQEDSNRSSGHLFGLIFEHPLDGAIHAGNLMLKINGHHHVPPR